MHAFDVLSRANLLHTVVFLVAGALTIALFVQMVLSWVLRGQENAFSHFIRNVTAPVLAPLDRVIPPIVIGGLQFPISFFAAWWAIGIVAALLDQALPVGW
jgi:uncharacterized protein YggT (Ycf19 family)